MTQASVDKVAEVVRGKENGKLDKDPVHNETLKVVSRAEESGKGDGNNASNGNFPTNAVDEWPVSKKIHSFYFVRYRLYDDPRIKAKIEQADKELQKWNKARFKITDELKAIRSDRSELLTQVRALNVDFDQFKEILDEKKKEIEPLQQALGKLRNNNHASGGICSSEEDLNAVIHCLQYRIQHESIPLAEEKQILREIERLEGTRETVISNDATRAKIQDLMGQKEVIQDQVKLMGVDLDGVRKEQHAVQSKKKLIKDKLDRIEKKIKSLQEELKDVTQKRDKAYATIQELRRQRDEENAYYYQSRSLLNKAKIVAAKKDIKALEELSASEVEKFMDLWNGKKAIRDDYEKRILASLDSRQLSRDGRIRNPDEKQLVPPELPVHSETETIPKLTVRQPKEAKPSPQPGTKNPKRVQKDAETKVMESKSAQENVVSEKEISGSGKMEKDASANKDVDAAKLKEKKREEEIAKAKQALERKKKQAEKAAAKATIRAQKEAEKKLEKLEKKAKKKATTSTTASNPEEPTESVAESSESEKVDVPVSAPVSAKNKVQKENTIRNRNRTKGPESLPKAVLRRKKSINYWTWAAPAALLVLILLALVYHSLLV